MSIETLANINVPLELTATDLVAVVIALMLIINAIARAKRTRLCNPGLWRANLAMIVSVLCSISVVFNHVDPLIGNRSLLNCFTHLILVYVGWQLALATTRILEQVSGETVKTLLIHPWVPVASAIGVVITFAILNPGSSRGLDDYDHEIVYILYWVATVAPFIFATCHIVPRFIRLYPVIKHAHWTSRVSITLLWLGYVGIPFSVAGWTVTAFAPEFYVIREVIVNGTLFLFCAASLMATAALPRPKEKQTPPRIQVPTPMQPQ